MLHAIGPRFAANKPTIIEEAIALVEQTVTFQAARRAVQAADPYPDTSPFAEKTDATRTLRSLVDPNNRDTLMQVASDFFQMIPFQPPRPKLPPVEINQIAETLAMVIKAYLLPKPSTQSPPLISETLVRIAKTPTFQALQAGYLEKGLSHPQATGLALADLIAPQNKTVLAEVATQWAKTIEPQATITPENATQIVETLGMVIRDFLSQPPF